MRPTRRIAFVTSREFAGLTDDDRLALAPLLERGLAAEPAVWSDERVRWEEFDRIICRSPWDYYLMPDRFLEWLGAAEARSLPLHNPASVIRWNIEKSYLRELEAAGIPIVPTAWVGRGEPARLNDILRERGWDRSVVKPTLSASAHETWIVGREATPADESRFRRIAAASGVMVQQYMDQIESAGEWSLLFFEGRYSHAVVKRPRDGDFRVQSDFGGTVEAAAPTKELIRQAAGIVASAPGSLLYARVDGLASGDRLVLMELELFEPALFLHAEPGAPARFADAVARLCS